MKNVVDETLVTTNESKGLHRHCRSYNSTDISTASDIHSVIKQRIINTNSKTSNENRLSICIAFCVLFHIQLQFTMYINSLWPFMVENDPKISETFYGFVATIFFLTGAGATPLFGKLSDKIGTKMPIILGLILTSVGSSLFPFVHLFQVSQRKWAILASRTIAGISTGIRSSIFAYSVDASSVNNRGKIVAVRTTVEALGMLLGPLFQTAFVPVGNHVLFGGLVNLNMYTLPALLTLATSIIGIFVMIILFQDLPRKKTSAVNLTNLSEGKIDKCSIWITLMARTGQVIINSGISTISSPLAMVMFGWTDAKIIWFNSILFAIQGVVTVPMNMFLGLFVQTFIKERALILVGIIIQILTFLFAFPWPWYPSLMSNMFSFVTMNTTGNETTISEINDSKNFIEVEQYQKFEIISIQSNFTDSYNRIILMCSYKWCDKIPIMYVGCLIVLILGMFLSNGMGKVSTASLFANMLGPKSQGVWQGIYASMELLGLSFGPLATAVIFQYYGPQVLFAIFGVLSCVFMVPFVYLYKNMISWYEIEGNDYGTSNQKRLG